MVRGGVGAAAALVLLLACVCACAGGDTPAWNISRCGAPGVFFPQSSYVAYVGRTLSIAVKGNDSDAGDEVQLYVLEDPGLPNNASVGESQCQGPLISTGAATTRRWCNPLERHLRWTPFAGQEGTTYTVSFVGRDTNSSCDPPAHSPAHDCCEPGGHYSRQESVSVYVQPPVVAFDGGTPGVDRAFHTPVGCDVAACFSASDTTGMYGVDISATTPLPPGATFDASCAADGAGERPAAACKKCLHWVPARGMESNVSTFCVRAHDTHSLAGVDRCITIEVPRCKYCVAEGDSLQSINKQYGLSTSWVQLWNSNGNSEVACDPSAPRQSAHTCASRITTPDALAEIESIVHLGPVYSVKPGDTLALLAARMRTTMKKILSLNPDVDGVNGVSPGQQLCMQPCTDDYHA